MLNLEGIIMASPDADFYGLMARLHQGDPDAAAILLQDYDDEVRTIVRRHLAHDARRLVDSTDVTQSVWCDFFTHQLPNRQFADEQELRLCLRLLSRYKALCANRRYLNSQRRDLRRDCPLEELSEEARQRLVDPHATAAETLEIQEALETAIACLSPRDQTVLVLIGEGYTYQEIAERVGCTERSVQRILSRVLEFLHWKRSKEDGLQDGGSGGDGSGRRGN
jgi:RNA polymerase sigma factor (sigma-70 family)